MPVNVRSLGQHLELDFCRSNLQIGNERVDDSALFLGTTQHKVHRNDLNHLDVAMVFGVDDAVLYFFNRNIFSEGVQRLLDRVFLDKSLKLSDLSLLQIHLEPITTFRLLLLLNTVLVCLIFLCPAGQD